MEGMGLGTCDPVELAAARARRKAKDKARLMRRALWFLAVLALLAGTAVAMAYVRSLALAEPAATEER